MDCGTMAYALPNGTLLACTFDPELVEELYEMEGMELRKNKIDTLLGPGINIHRNPLNGRNFEYFSEDPYLTGIMAAAQLTGNARNVSFNVSASACSRSCSMRLAVALACRFVPASVICSRVVSSDSVSPNLAMSSAICWLRMMSTSRVRLVTLSIVVPSL